MLAVLLLAWTGGARGETSAAAREDAELTYDTAADVTVAASGAFVTLLFQVELNRELVPRQCRWCEPPTFDAEARSALVWKDPMAAEVAGTLAGFVGAPAVAFGSSTIAAADEGRSDEIWANHLVVAEAVAVTLALTHLVKPLAGRERPAVHYRSARAAHFPEQERNASFFSGHSSLAFSFAVSSGTVASMRRYRLAPLVWGSGLAVAGFTAYSRVAADAHYLSDVVVGSAVGAAVGFGMPYWLHGPRAPSPQSAEPVAWYPAFFPIEGGAAAGIAGTL